MLPVDSLHEGNFAWGLAKSAIEIIAINARQAGVNGCFDQVFWGAAGQRVSVIIGPIS